MTNSRFDLKIPGVPGDGGSVPGWGKGGEDRQPGRATAPPGPEWEEREIAFSDVRKTMWQEEPLNLQSAQPALSALRAGSRAPPTGRGPTGVSAVGEQVVSTLPLLRAGAALRYPGGHRVLCLLPKHLVYGVCSAGAPGPVQFLETK